MLVFEAVFIHADASQREGGGGGGGGGGGKEKFNARIAEWARGTGAKCAPIDRLTFCPMLRYKFVLPPLPLFFLLAMEDRRDVVLFCIKFARVENESRGSVKRVRGREEEKRREEKAFNR